MPEYGMLLTFHCKYEQVVELKGGSYIEDCMDYIEGLGSAKSADVLLASMSQRRSSRC